MNEIAAAADFKIKEIKERFSPGDKISLNAQDFLGLLELVKYLAELNHKYEERLKRVSCD